MYGFSWLELMSLVYRIQSKQDRTRGAYSTLTKYAPYLQIVDDMCFEHNMQQDNHPQPHNDKGINNRNSNEYCGFNSATALLQWFKGWIPDLLRAGYEIVALQDITITAVGEYQVLFTFND